MQKKEKQRWVKKPIWNDERKEKSILLESNETAVIDQS